MKLRFSVGDRKQSSIPANSNVSKSEARIAGTMIEGCVLLHEKFFGAIQLQCAYIQRVEKIERMIEDRKGGLERNQGTLCILRLNEAVDGVSIFLRDL